MEAKRLRLPAALHQLQQVQKHLATGHVGHFYGQELNLQHTTLAQIDYDYAVWTGLTFDIYKGDTLRR